MDKFDFEIEGIKYELEKFSDLNYTIQKMNEYLNKFGLENSIRSQKFIRHLHIHIALKLQKEINISPDKIHFEVKLKNKNVDIAIIDNDKVKLAVTIRSQSSSIKKNFTNNINSLQGEVVSLKTLYSDMRVGLVYLLKKVDIDTEDDCTNYYFENIPKKLLPLINTSIPTKDRFDAAMLIVWDIDTQNKVYIDYSNLFTQIFNEETFIKDVKNILDEEKINSQFSLDQLSKEKMIEFLKNK